jgi:hypothetical protein
MTAAKVCLAMAAMGQKETKVTDLCSELAITRQTLYRHVAPDGHGWPRAHHTVIGSRAEMQRQSVFEKQHFYFCGVEDRSKSKGKFRKYSA